MVAGTVFEAQSGLGYSLDVINEASITGVIPEVHVAKAQRLNG